LLYRRTMNSNYLHLMCTPSDSPEGYHF
jgi:hypothetical protein